VVRKLLKKHQYRRYFQSCYDRRKVCKQRMLQN